MAIPPWRELPWPTLVRTACIYLGAVQLAGIAGALAYWMMDWFGGPWVGGACDLIATVATFHALHSQAHKPWE